MDLKNVRAVTDQELLLKAIFLEGEEAREACREWNQVVDWEEIEFESIKLLPLLYSRFKEQIPADRFKIIRGVYVRAWYENQIRFKELASILKALEAEKIQPMLLKGAALVPTYYKELGLRPMQDMDILVREPQLEALIQVVERLGWHCPHTSRRRDFFRRESHGVSYVKKVKSIETKVDLHWRALWCSKQPGIDNGFWEHAVKKEVEGSNAYVLSDTDQLLHVCVHGLRRDYYAPRWVADSLMILRSKPKIEWERLIAESRKRFLTPIVCEALEYLREVFHADIPQEVIQKMASFEKTEMERYHYNITVDHNMKTPQNYWETLRAQWPRFLYDLRTFENEETIARMSLWEKMSRFIRWMKKHYEVESVFYLPVIFLRKIVRKPSRFLWARKIEE